MKLKFGFLLLAMTTACTFSLYAQSAKSTQKATKSSYELVKDSYTAKMRTLNATRKTELNAVRKNSSLSHAQNEAQQGQIQQRYIQQKKVYDLELRNAKKA